jgi:hypothetical protein
MFNVVGSAEIRRGGAMRDLSLSGSTFGFVLATFATVVFD